MKCPTPVGIGSVEDMLARLAIWHAHVEGATNVAIHMRVVDVVIRVRTANMAICVKVACVALCVKGIKRLRLVPALPDPMVEIYSPLEFE